MIKSRNNHQSLPSECLLTLPCQNLNGRSVLRRLRICERDLRPISIVEGGGFKEFCKKLNPSYDVQGRTTIAKYVSLSYDQLNAELIKTISSQPGVSLTTDHWTSLATEGYITVTGHFIDEDWKFNNCILATRKTTEKHSG